jgi:hypothetical protein
MKAFFAVRSKDDVQREREEKHLVGLVHHAASSSSSSSRVPQDGENEDPLDLALFNEDDDSFDLSRVPDWNLKKLSHANKSAANWVVKTSKGSLSLDQEKIPQRTLCRGDPGDFGTARAYRRRP